MSGDEHESGLSQELLLPVVHCVIIKHREGVLLLVQLENSSRVPVWSVWDSLPSFGLPAEASSLHAA